ncbi:MAG: hypothetical protein NC400_00715 [Clostridium sp.]|nr:hypothetical protein [Clostridium sp.]
MDNKVAVYTNKICMVTVKIIGAVLMTYLFLLSIFSTSVRSVRNYGTAENPEWGRYTYFLPDNPIKHILVIVIVIAALWVIKKYGFKWKESKRRSSLLRKAAPKIICGIYFLLAILYILNTQFLPKSDPAGVLRIAEEILNQDFHEFEKEGYMYRYPYQSGFVFLCMAAVKLFGNQAYLVLQVVNAMAITVFFYLLGKLVMLWWGYNEKQVLYFMFASMVCSLPVLMYTSFIYGNLPGMALSAAAVYEEQLFLRERKISNMLRAAVCISIAVVLKGNCLISLIAMLIILIWDIFRGDKRKSTLYAIVCILFCHVLFNQGVLFAMGAITGQKLSEGMPKTALIAMGLEESAAGPGTESGESNRIYEENNYEYGASNNAAKEKIFFNLKRYMDSPASLISFFARKQALQCNEPTFQAFSITGGRETHITVPAWLNYLIAGKGSLLLIEMMNIMHTFILFGVCITIFNIDAKKQNLNELCFLIIFIGAFIFQMFYEAKSQYMLIFFFPLLPYTAEGYNILIGNLNKLRKNRDIIIGYIKRNRIKLSIVTALVCMILAAGCKTGLFAHTICIQSSDELIEEYEEVIRTKENPNG